MPTYKESSSSQHLLRPWYLTYIWVLLEDVFRNLPLKSFLLPVLLFSSLASLKLYSSNSLLLSLPLPLTLPSWYG